MKYSPYSPSLDEALYPKKGRPRTPGLWRWLLLLGFGLFFVYRSTLPVARLQSEPPPQFIGRSDSQTIERPQPDKQIAREYWRVAVRSIQSEYAPKISLPAAPPPDFRINSRTAEASVNGDAERAVYWQRLRDLWTQPEIWQVTYGWNTGWFMNAVSNLPQYLGEILQQLVAGLQSCGDQLVKLIP
jgi:hypothetical protein